MTKFSSKRTLTDAEEDKIQAMISSDPDALELTEEQAKRPMSLSDAVKRRLAPLSNAQQPRQ